MTDDAYESLERRRGTARGRDELRAVAPSAAQTRSIVERVAENDPRPPEGRVAVLTALHELGFGTAVTKDRASSAAPHTLVLWVDDANDPTLYAVEDERLPASIDSDLDTANGLVLDDVGDCSVFQLAALLRLAAALGRASVEELVERVGAVRAARSPDPDLGSLPSTETLRELAGALRAHRVARGADGGRLEARDALDAPISRSVAIADRVIWHELAGRDPSAR